MPRKSIVEIRNSEIRWKQGSDLRKSHRNSTKSSLVVSSRNGRKRQRRLFEFDIPTVSELPVQQRNGHTLVRNERDNPILIDEDLAIDFVNDSKNRNKTSIIGTIDEREDYVEIEEEQEQEVDIEILSEETVGGPIAESDGTSISCPICNRDLSSFKLYEREAHCETCFGDSLDVEVVEDVKQIIIYDDVNLQGTHQHNDIVLTEVKKAPKNKKKEAIKKPKRVRPPLPSIKKLSFSNNVQLVVDGFNYQPDDQISMYFLSHFHSDHYIGLNKSWDKGIIYCSEITSKLLRLKFKVPEEKIIELTNNEKFWVTDCISVIPYDANHCPGAQVYLFQEYETTAPEGAAPIRQMIHTGDFRSNEVVRNCFKNEYPIDLVYLDTTYLSHTNNFPTQDEVVNKTSEYVVKYFKEKDIAYDKGARYTVIPRPQKKLILVGVYSIGKEKLALKICEQMKCRCFVYNKELRSCYMNCSGTALSDDKIMVHMVPLSVLKDDATIMDYIQKIVKMKWLEVDVIGIVPTGWTFGNMWESRNLRLTRDEKYELSKKVRSDEGENMTLDNNWFVKQLKPSRKFQIFKVPYSEHSSFNELVKFATSTEYQWGKILATVNLETVERMQDMNEYFEVWKDINNRR